MALPAWAAQAQPYLDRLALWRGYEADLTNLTIVAVGVTIYTLIVFAFYANLSRRAAFHSGWGKGKWWGTLIHALEGTFVFPVMSFLYFGVLALALFFLAKTQTTYQIFLLSMAVVTAVRLTSFVKEDAAGDLAKLMPLALLGVMIVDPNPATWSAVWARYLDVVTLAPVLARFFLLFLVLESGLRVGNLLVAKWRSSRLRTRLVPSREESVSLDVKASEAPIRKAP